MPHTGLKPISRLLIQEAAIQFLDDFFPRNPAFSRMTRPIRVARNEEIRQRRITSYNVCYTKLCIHYTKLYEYMEMVNSFIDGGFTESICEYIYVDNTKGNSYDAYSGFNNCLHQAQGKYIIFCHQDVLLKHHNYQTLHLRIQQMDAIDPQWAILANAGSVNLKYKITHVSYNFV